MAIYISREDLLEIVNSPGHDKLVMASTNYELNAKIRAGILQRAKYQPEWEQFPNRVLIHEATEVILPEKARLTRAQMELPEVARIQWMPATLFQFRQKDQILKLFDKGIRDGNVVRNMSIEESIYIDLDRPVGEIRITYTALPEFQ